jgi:hypothetical protein
LRDSGEYTVDLGRPRLPKKAETFYFFNIEDPAVFKQKLAKLVPMITTGQEAKDTRSDLYARKKSGKTGLIQLTAINISFSYTGMKKVGFNIRSSYKYYYLQRM